MAILPLTLRAATRDLPDVPPLVQFLIAQFLAPILAWFHALVYRPLLHRWQVEPMIAFLVRYQGCRRARRVGLAAAQCQLYQACAVRNLLLWLRRVRRGLAPRPG